jgi:hypothetical protein
MKAIKKQVKISYAWMRLHPEYFPNEQDAFAIADIITYNKLDWTVLALEVAYQILLMKGRKFQTKPKSKTIEEALDELTYAQKPHIGVGWVRKQNRGDLKIYEVRIHNT